MRTINVNIICCGLVLLVLFFSTGFAQVIPSVPLEKDVQNYNINTADNYSLRTRSDTYTFENVKVSEIANVIKQNLSDYGAISINETLNMLVIKEEGTKLENILKLCEKLDVQKMGEFLKIRTRRIPLLYNQPSDLAVFLTPYLSVDGKIQYDDNFNVIIVHDHETKLDQIEEEIKKFDVPPKELKIDVEIVIVEKGGMLDAGINWDEFLSDNRVTGNIDVDQSYSKSETKERRVDSREYWSISERKSNSDGQGVDLHLSVPRLNDVIRFLEENQQAKVISSPSIITLNNKEGQMWVGSREFFDKYPYAEELKFGLLLRVIPHVGESDLITLDVECELGDVESGQKIVNRILAKEGETFLLGGMSKVNEYKVKKRVPILGHILPFIFSRNSTQEKVVDVLLLLTPSLVDVEQFGERSLEMKEKIKEDG